MIPTIGRTVIVHGVSSNGATEHPAIITRVWGAGRDTRDSAVCINCTVFMDCGPASVFSSVMLFENREQVQAHRGENPKAVVAHWPDLVAV
ncbi:MAG: hypothetical protein RL375_3918 [Pseudomonadota bacterium]